MQVPIRSFKNLDDFIKESCAWGVFYFHVFDNAQDEELLLALGDLSPHECVLAGSHKENREFLAQIFRGNLRPSIHIWVKGQAIGMALCASEVAGIQRMARKGYQELRELFPEGIP